MVNMSRSYHAKLANGKTIEGKLPLTLYETPTGMFEKVYDKWDGLVTHESLAKLFAIITDQDIKDYLDSTDERLEATIVKCTQFILENQVDLNKLEVPKFFKYKEDLIMLPTELRNMTLGQNLYIRSRGINKDIRGCVALATAVYLQPLIDHTGFNDKRAEALAMEFRDLPITEIYPIGFFICRRLNSNGSGRKAFSDPISKTMLLSIIAVISLLKSPWQICWTHMLKSLLFVASATFFQRTSWKIFSNWILRRSWYSYQRIHGPLNFKNVIEYMKGGWIKHKS